MEAFGCLVVEALVPNPRIDIQRRDLIGMLDARLNDLFAVLNITETEQPANNRCWFLDQVFGPDLVIASPVQPAEASGRPDLTRPVAGEGFGEVGKGRIASRKLAF